MRPGTEEEAARARTKIVVALVSVYIIWGSTYYAMRIAVESMPPFLMGGIRFLAAGAMLYVLCRLRGAPTPKAAEWRGSAFVGTLLCVGGNGGVAVAERSIGSGVAAVVVATMPLWAVAFGWIFGVRPRRTDLIGLGLGFLGVAVLQAGTGLQGTVVDTLAITFSPMFWAFGSVWSRRLPLPAGLMAAASEMLTGGLVMLLLGFAVGERIHEVPPAPAVISMVYLVVFGSLVGFTAYTYLLRTTRPAVATSYAYVNPIIAIAIGVVLGREAFGIRAVFATLLTIGGLVILSLPRLGAPRASPS